MEQLLSNIILSNNLAFAILLDNDIVITTSCSEYGGNSNNVKSKLINVKYIYFTYSAFVAFLENSNVII